MDCDLIYFIIFFKFRNILNNINNMNFIKCYNEKWGCCKESKYFLHILVGTKIA